jgi:hypothetical protein
MGSSNRYEIHVGTAGRNFGVQICLSVVHLRQKCNRYFFSRLRFAACCNSTSACAKGCAAMRQNAA